ncbi:flavodoxin domain-containing protein [Microbacterium sp. K24]|uniref:flavodoxin family protein n=1 Tax=Microbacterium sp. K24 TaxID=2305446 RepID=UPI00109C873F|nr:flavodoxin domain-containing protein [Microbacterium sp. K24]
MRALVVYESMFGNTRAIAESICLTFERSAIDVTITTVSAAPRSTVGFDLLVVGAPTHAHSLPRPTSRLEAAAWAADPARTLTLEHAEVDHGVREWLDELVVSDRTRLLAAFSTRADIMRALAGDAAVAIKRRLKGPAHKQVEMECFIVNSENQLVDGQRERAEAWGLSLARTAAVAA